MVKSSFSKGSKTRNLKRLGYLPLGTVRPAGSHSPCDSVTGQAPPSHDRHGFSHGGAELRSVMRT